MFKVHRLKRKKINQFAQITKAIGGIQMPSKKVGIGVIGCGTISDTYLTNLTQHYTNVDVKACADVFAEKAEQARDKFKLPKACTVDELLADADIEIVLNLTIPAAHHEVNMQILRAGKHVYCEKPMALSLSDALEAAALARQKQLMLCSAPDTFLGAGVQTCLKLLDDGVIGKPTGFTANMVSPGVDMWHPAPSFYYKKGGGPMLDMGAYYLTALVALLGPIKRVACFTTARTDKREIYGEYIDVEVPTHYAGIVEFASGVVGNINMSFDVWDSKLPCIEIYGENGMMEVPDPNVFSGQVKVCDGQKIKRLVESVEGPHVNRLMKLLTCKDECTINEELLFPAPENPRTNMRGLGVSDMARALAGNTKSRLSAELSTHVVEAMTAFDISSKENRPYVMTTTCERPEPMVQGLELWQTE